MKKNVVFLACCCILLLLCSCAGQNGSEIRGENDTVSNGTVSGEKDVASTMDISDRELIEAALKSETLEFWLTASSPGPYTQERFDALCEYCEPIGTLAERESGLESLKVYGPELVEEYLKSENSRHRLNAKTLADVISFQYPELKESMEALITDNGEA